MTSIEGTVEQTIRRYRLIRPGDTVLLAVSGGPDSMAMLHILLALRHRLGCRLLIGHVNHHLRKTAETDEKFVRKASAALGLPLVVASVRPGKIDDPGSLEERAREKRLAALARMANRKKCRAVALAHHRQDAAETVLMRVLRGTGLMGLQGILPERAMCGTTWIRPLIHLERAQIEQYLKTRRIVFRRDPSNRNKRFLRNRLRRELLPMLKTYNPRILEALTGLGETAALDYTYIAQHARKHAQPIFRKTSRQTLQVPVTSLKPLTPSMRRAVIRLAVEEIKGDLRRLTLAHIRGVERLLFSETDGAAVDLPADVRVMRKKDTLFFIRRNS